MGLPGHYGYYLVGEGYSLRACNFVPKSEFSTMLRIIPNSIVYTIGGWNLHDKLMTIFQTGYGRKELPLIPIILLWLAPFTILLLTTFKALKVEKRLRYFLILIAFAFSIGALFQLTYVTIAHRYIAEIWPAFLIGISIFIYMVFTSKIKISTLSVIVLSVATIFTLVYNLNIAFFSGYHFRPEIKDDNEYHYSDKINNQLNQLTNEKINLFNKEYRLNKKAGCDELKAIIEKKDNNRDLK